MSVLSYLNFFAGATVTNALTTIDPNVAWQNPALGQAAVLTWFSGPPVIYIDLLSAGGAAYPVDVVGLLGTDLQWGLDYIGMTAKLGATTVYSAPYGLIREDWPAGKLRNFVWRIPRAQADRPQWVDSIRIEVRFGTGGAFVRQFGQGYYGPGICFSPTTRLEYGWTDSPAKMERNLGGEGLPVEYPPRRTVSLTTENLPRQVAFELGQYQPAPGTGGIPFYVEAQRNLQRVLAQYLSRGARVLLVPAESGRLVSRLAEYGRLANDPVVREIAADRFALDLAFEED